MKIHLVALLALFALGTLLTGCATPIADAYQEPRLQSPVHKTISLAIATTEMLVLNPTLYYPLETIGLADFDLVWRDEEDEMSDPEEESLATGFFVDEEPHEMDPPALEEPEVETEEEGSEEEGSPEESPEDPGSGT